MRALIALSLLLLPLTLRAEEPPTSTEELARQFEIAISSRNTEAVLALFYWQGADEEMKSMYVSTGVPMMFYLPVKSVKVAPLPAAFETSFEKDGKRYVPTLPITGLLTVEYATPGNTLQQSYGEKDGKFYLSFMKSEKIAGLPAIKDKQLSVNVSVNGDGPKTFDGSCVYLLSGKEITLPLVDKFHGGNASEAFWGEKIKSCTVRKTSEGGEISVTLKEDGKALFKVNGEKSNKTITYSAAP